VAALAWASRVSILVLARYWTFTATVADVVSLALAVSIPVTVKLWVATVVAGVLNCCNTGTLDSMHIR